MYVVKSYSTCTIFIIGYGIKLYGTGTGSGMIKKIKKYRRVESNNTFPTFTLVLPLNQVFWDKPAFSGS